MSLYKVVHSEASGPGANKSQTIFVRLEGLVKWRVPKQATSGNEESQHWQDAIEDTCSMVLFLHEETGSVLTKKYGLRGPLQLKKVIPNACNPLQPLSFRIVYNYSAPRPGHSATGALTPSLRFMNYNNSGDNQKDDQKLSSLSKTVSIFVDGLFPVENPESGSESLYSVCVRQLDEYLQWCVSCWSSTAVTPLRGFHYLLEDTGLTVLTLLYPLHSVDLLEEEKLRQNIHKSLQLPGDWPRFRRSQAVTFGSKIFNKLVSPHRLLKLLPDQLNTHTVRGDYLYAHYRQDGENDDYWGCAYRSLQTVLSWYHMAGYIRFYQLPSLKRIQEALVQMKDKPSKFVGSREWIGSMEVNLCVKYFCDEASLQENGSEKVPPARLQFVSSGAELCEQVEMLTRHFQEEGTPVMIGGGQYAHTILGVAVPKESSTGLKPKFLVLDPHFTGSDEDLRTILDKGWVGWKEVSFFDAKAFYNMCLPVRPRGRF